MRAWPANQMKRDGLTGPSNKGQRLGGLNDSGCPVMEMGGLDDALTAQSELFSGGNFYSLHWRVKLVENVYMRV